MQPSFFPCGSYHLAETTVFHYAGYECAAWWRDTLVPAGDYPVFGYRQGSSIHFTADLAGTITEDNFQSLWCGTPIGDGYNCKQNAGKPSTYTMRTVDYCLFAEMKSKGEACPWRIDLAALKVDLGHCEDCSGLIIKHPHPTRQICPGCAVAREKALRQQACRRHRFLLSTGYGLRTTRDSGYLDTVIANVQAKTIMSDFYLKILMSEVAAMRAAGPARRMEARNRYPVPNYMFVAG